MAGKPAEIVAGFAFDVLVEVLIGDRVLAAGEDKFLPDKDALGIAEVVEVIAFVLAARPRCAED